MPELQLSGNAPSKDHADEMRDQLHAETLRVVGQLVGGIAHDFNNFLLLISFCSEQLLAQLPDGDANRKTVTAISDAGSRAAGLVRQLLAISQRQSLEMAIIDLNELIVRANQVIRGLIQSDVQITLNLAPAAVMVNVDRDQFDHVLLNLILNAQDAMPSGGRLTIETCLEQSPDGERVGDRDGAPRCDVLLSVSDTGCGMTDEVKSRAFEPYFTTKDVGKGTGLGLAVVHGIVSQFGGRIGVKSEVGVGTTFEIRFPAAQGREVSPISTDNRLQSPPKAETILVVEDEANLRRFLKSNLESHGYDVLDAPHGPAAIAIAIRHSQNIDLLLTDVELPEMSGYAVAETLQADYPGLPTIFISGFGGGSLQKGHSNRFDSFLQKPFKVSELLTKVRETLSNRNANNP